MFKLSPFISACSSLHPKAARRKQNIIFQCTQNTYYENHFFSWLNLWNTLLCFNSSHATKNSITSPILGDHIIQRV